MKSSLDDSESSIFQISLLSCSRPQQLFWHSPPSIEDAVDDPMRIPHMLDLGECDLLIFGEGASGISYLRHRVKLSRGLRLIDDNRMGTSACPSQHVRRFWRLRKVPAVWGCFHVLKVTAWIFTSCLGCVRKVTRPSRRQLLSLVIENVSFRRPPDLHTRTTFLPG